MTASPLSDRVDKSASRAVETELRELHLVLWWIFLVLAVAAGALVVIAIVLARWGLFF